MVTICYYYYNLYNSYRIYWPSNKIFQKSDLDTNMIMLVHYLAFIWKIQYKWMKLFTLKLNYSVHFKCVNGNVYLFKLCLFTLF